MVEEDLLKSPEADSVSNNTRNLVANTLADKKITDIRAGSLIDLDREYYADLIARCPKESIRFPRNLDDPDYKYFTVLSASGEKLGIIGIFNTDHDKNISDTIVDPKYRGRGLAREFKNLLMSELDLPFLTMIVDYDPHAPNDPSRTNVASIKAIKKLPNVKRIADPNYDAIQKAKFVYERRTSEVVNFEMKTLEAIKERIDRRDLQEKSWAEIRKEFYIPLNQVGDKNLIFKVLGETALMKYFKALSGEGKPYKFPLLPEADDLSEYLAYEFSEAPAYFIADLLKKSLSKAGVNILISHCVHIPAFTLSAIETIDKENLNRFLTQLINKYPAATVMLGKVFGDKRITLLKKLDQYNSEANPAPPELIEELHDLERSLFGKGAMDKN